MSKKTTSPSSNTVKTNMQRASGLHINPAGTEEYFETAGTSSPTYAPSEVKKLFQPARTLGVPDDVYTACDSQLEACGVYSLLQHSLKMGMLPQTQFLGYATLQQIAQNGLIRACIETLTDDMTRNWIELKREGESDNTADKSASNAGAGNILASMGLQDNQAEAEAADQLSILKSEMKRLNLRKVLHDAAGLVGYMGGCLIYIDTGETDPQRLKEPLHIGAASVELRSDRPLRFVPIDPVNVFPGLYNSSNPLRSDFFQPRSWWILGQEVHASRLIRLVANELPVLLKPAYNFLGEAQAQILWDYVMHFQSLRVASQRLLGKFSLTVLKTDMQNVLTQNGAIQELDKRVALLVKHRSNDGVQVIDKEAEEIVKLETPLSGVTDLVRQALEILAAMNRTPAVKLLGISPSGFNATGESDIRNYYDHVLSQQEKVLRPAIEHILKILQIRLFGKLDESITFDFAPLSEADSAAVANTQKVKADTIAALLDRGIISPEEARQALADDPDSAFADIDADDVPESDDGGADMEGSDMPDGSEPAQGADIDDADKAGAIDGAMYPALDASRAWLFWSAEDANAEFDKSKHPQGEGGKFIKTGSAASHPQDITNLLGEEIKGVKGEAAISAIMDKQGGHVKGAFHNRYIPEPIDIFWGDDTCGLKHIIKRRMADGQDVGAVLENLSSTIANGTVKRNNNIFNDPRERRWTVSKGNCRVVVSSMLRGNKLTYVLTDFEVY